MCIACGCSEGAEHLVDALLLLLRSGMDVEIESRGYVGMAEDDTDGLVVAVAFDTACGETMSEPVEFQRRYAKLFHQLHIVVAVGARFNWLRFVAYDVVVAVDNLLQRSYHRHKSLVDWNLADGVGGLGCVDHNLSVLGTVIFENINSLHRALYCQHGAFGVEIAPLQAAYFTDAQPGSKADVYAEIAECEVLTDVVQNLAVVSRGQNFYALLFGSGRIFDIPLAVPEVAVFLSEADYHFQNNDNVLDVLLTQTGVKSVNYKRLYIRFGHSIKTAEGRDNLVFYYQRVD